MRRSAIKAAIALAVVVAGPSARPQTYHSGISPDQSYTITSTATGTWSTTYARATRNANPIVISKPHVNAQASPNQTICTPTSVSNTAASGFCSVSQATTATVNASIQPFTASGAIQVDIVVKEPTQ